MSDRLSPLQICQEAMAIFAELAPDAELVQHKGPKIGPWVVKTVLIDLGKAFPESLDEFREKELRPAMTMLRASLPQKLRILRFRDLNPVAVQCAQVEYESLSLRFCINHNEETGQDIGQFSIIVDGTA